MITPVITDEGEEQSPLRILFRLLCVWGWDGVGESVTFKLGPAGQKGVSLSRTSEKELQVEVPEMGRNLACWRNGGQASVAGAQ